MPRVWFRVQPEARKVRVTTQGPVRFRFTLQRMITGVAILACLICLLGLPWADRYGVQIAIHSQLVSHLEGEIRYISELPQEQRFAYHKPMLVKYERLLAYHQRMRTKYERAARYFWLPVEPDPPGPE